MKEKCPRERGPRTISEVRVGRIVGVLLLLAGCNSGNEADRVGVGRGCARDADCPIVECDVEPCPVLVCLTRFGGGYCGLADCVADVDCPLGSACVIHDDGINYCFRLCDNKPECNLHRAPESESNCSSSVEFVEESSSKACVPPSSGG